MRYCYCPQIMLLTYFLFMLSCTKYNGIYSDMLQEKNSCARKCSEETNDELRIQCFTKAIHKNPDNPDLYFNRGKTYRKTFKFTSAISDFIKVIELEPGNTEAYYSLASTASLAYKKEYALYWLKKAIEAGYNDYHQISVDPSLDNIRNTKKFKTLLQKWGQELSSAM